jgi:hypothetical protein
VERRRFLRQVGVAIAAGVGVAALPAAAATNVQCCPSTDCPACRSGYHRFRCRGGLCNYCVCTTRTSCWWYTCGQAAKEAVA